MNDNPDPDKVKYLNESGNWFQWYHVDNWIMQKWVDEGKAYDRMGVSTEFAYKYEKLKKNEK